MGYRLPNLPQQPVLWGVVILAARTNFDCLLATCKWDDEAGSVLTNTIDPPTRIHVHLYACLHTHSIGHYVTCDPNGLLTCQAGKCLRVKHRSSRDSKLKCCQSNYTISPPWPYVLLLSLTHALLPYIPACYTGVDGKTQDAISSLKTGMSFEFSHIVIPYYLHALPVFIPLCWPCSDPELEVVRIWRPQ